MTNWRWDLNIGYTNSLYFWVLLFFPHSFFLCFDTLHVMLQTLVSSLEQKIDDTEKKYQENKQNQWGEAQAGNGCWDKNCWFEHGNAKVFYLPSPRTIAFCFSYILGSTLFTYIKSQKTGHFLLLFCFRLQEKISTMESEEKVQRQALLSTPVKSMSEHLSIPIAPKVPVMEWLVNEGSYYSNYFVSLLNSSVFIVTQNLENGYHEVEEHKVLGLSNLHFVPWTFIYAHNLVFNCNFPGTPKCTPCY